MTHSGYTPLGTMVPISEDERTPDRLADLLECMADLLVATRAQRVELERLGGGEDPRVGDVLLRLAELEHSLEGVGVEAATVHHSLQQLHLI